LNGGFRLTIFDLGGLRASFSSFVPASTALQGWHQFRCATVAQTMPK